MKDAGPSGDAAGPVDVVPLLRSYRHALLLARRPPASLALSPALKWLHLRVRPRWGSHYFTARYVRRRIEALERELTARKAVGEADENDPQELEALTEFKSSLPPPPSRFLTVVALIAAILLSQAVLGWSLAELEFSDDPTDNSRIEQAFASVSLNPDVKSLADIGRALASANFVENGLVLLTVFLVLYVFGRPLASGYRLSVMCVGRPDWSTPRRRRSDLWRAAGRLEIPRKETTLARAVHADLPNDAPVDLLVKSLPWLAAGFWLFGFARFAGYAHATPSSLVLGLAIMASSMAVGPLVTRFLGTGDPARHRAIVQTVQIGLLVVGLAVVVHFRPWNGYHNQEAQLIWFGVAAFCVLRLGWLTRQLLARHCGPWWIGLPVIFICVIGLILPDVDYYSFSNREAREYAREVLGVSSVPRQSRADLHRLLQEHHDLSGVDFRGQDLHRLSLNGKRLAGAKFTLADLRRTDLSDANLRGANLTRVIATGARFKGADLRGAKLGCSDLRGANLTDAKLKGAVLVHAVVSPRTRWPAGYLPPGTSRPRDTTAPDVLTNQSRITASYDYVTWC